MSWPSVVAICLTKDREAMTRQAIRSFQSQTYPAKTLLIVNSGSGPLIQEGYAPDIMEPCYIGADAQTIGELRNRGAKDAAAHGADIIVHWDSDDLSHPNRIAEQVALLQSSAADAVGYNELLFWREPTVCLASCGPDSIADGCPGTNPGEAWLYSNPDLRYPPGSSLAYWRKTWERKPFEATSLGEDERFCRGLKVVSVSSLPCPGADYPNFGVSPQSDAPRLLCRIHPGNTSTAYKPSAMEAEARKRNGMWKRVPDWDAYCAAEFAR